ncbi:MAG: M50 family metallopeptidase [Litorimonas sp.]
MLIGLFNTVLFVSSFVLVLSFLVFFHELGHYSVARFFKVTVEKFSIGFGKPIVAWTSKAGVKWSISRIPLGGYVKFAGDAGAASNPDTTQLEAIKANMIKDGHDISTIFHFKPIWQRVLIVLAGPVANFILAVLIFAALSMAIGSRHIDTFVGAVTPNAPAAAAGFEVGDKVLSMDGKSTPYFLDILRHVQLRAGSDIETVVLRDGQEVTLTVRPEKIEQRDFVGGITHVGRVGLGTDTSRPFIYKRYNPAQALAFGRDEVGATLAGTGTLLKRIFTGKEDTKQLGSVIRIATITGMSAIDAVNNDRPVSDRVKALFIRLFSLAASISIALGVANLMPIPVLDGGHLLYYGYEAIAGRPLSQKKQELGFRMGFAVLLALFVMLTINDIGYVNSFFS